MSLICWTAKRPRLISLQFFLFIIMDKNNNNDIKLLLDIWRTGDVHVDFSLSWQECPLRLGLPGAVRL